jgi:hypothetical protein
MKKSQRLKPLAMSYLVLDSHGYIELGLIHGVVMEDMILRSDSVQLYST